MKSGMIHTVFYPYECISLMMAKARHSNLRRNKKEGE